MRNNRNKMASERGETQIGVLLWSAALGVFCFLVFSLQSCIKDYKDGKVMKRHEQRKKLFEPKVNNRNVRGYSVTVD